MRYFNSSTPLSIDERRLLWYNKSVQDKPKWVRLSMPSLLAAYATIVAWDALSPTVRRGELTNQVRMVATSVRLALPRAERGGSIYETQTVLEKPLYRIKDR